MKPCTDQQDIQQFLVIKDHLPKFLQHKVKGKTADEAYLCIQNHFEGNDVIHVEKAKLDFTDAGLDLQNMGDYEQGIMVAQETLSGTKYAGLVTDAAVIEKTIECFHSSMKHLNGSLVDFADSASAPTFNRFMLRLRKLIQKDQRQAARTSLVRSKRPMDPAESHLTETHAKQARTMGNTSGQVGSRGMLGPSELEMRMSQGKMCEDWNDLPGHLVCVLEDEDSFALKR
jgi:hypothetical protein